MTLAVGSRVGPYEILAPLGAGGMGEVFLAHDTRLGRDVALKVLPDSLAHDRERLQRFEREAHLLAGLNHPNIAALHGVEESGGVHALVMELVPGETLAERMARGPLPLEDALPIARQIAEALEEAHEHGVVHRDLKPQNVKLTPDGKVKVLDFGLAKALDPNAPSALSMTNSPTLVNSPTLTAAGTQLGVLLGTAAYMSPEQAKGKPVDKRGDIWAFGVVVWEMLSGRRLFGGDSVPETLGAIFRQEIPRDALPADLPAPLGALLTRCLERDPRQRLRDIGEARILLQRAEEGRLSPPHATAAAAMASPARWVAVALFALAALGVAYFVGRRSGVPVASAGPSAPARSPSFRKLTSKPGVETDPALSPDGKTLYFAARKSEGRDLDIFFVPVGGKKPINLTAESTDDDQYPAPSPDGSQIAFRSNRAGGGIFLMGATGESVRRLAGDCFDPAWSPDGRQLVCTTSSSTNPYDRGRTGVMGIVEVASGARRSLPTGDAAAPAWSPHGQRIAYWGIGKSESGWRDLWTVAVAGGDPVEVTQDAHTDWNPVWSEDGRALHFLSDRGGSPNLWRIAIDEASGRPQGEPESVVLPTEFALSARRGGGRWVYSTIASRSAIDRADFDLERQRFASPPRTILDTTNIVLGLALSPDGRTVAFAIERPQPDIFAMSADGGAAVQLTDDRARDRWPSWHPDGSRIFFMSNRGARYEMWSIRPDGSELTQVTRSQDESLWLPLLSPDGLRLAASSEKGALLFEASGPMPWEKYERLPNPEEPAGVYFNALSWSPDGKELAGALRFGGASMQPALYVVETHVVRAYEGQGAPRAWLPGRRVLVSGAGGIYVLDLESGGRSELLPASESLGVAPLGLATASRDGRVVVYLRQQSESDVWLAEGIE